MIRFKSPKWFLYALVKSGTRFLFAAQPSETNFKEETALVVNWSRRNHPLAIFSCLFLSVYISDQAADNMLD